jgi:hypothetical protein
MIIEEPSKRIIQGGKFRGQASAVFGYLKMLEETTPMDNDKERWTLRAYLITNAGGVANGSVWLDKQGGNLPLLAGLIMRGN